MYGILGNLQQLLGGQGPNSGGAQLQGPTSLSGYGRPTDMMARYPAPGGGASFNPGLGQPGAGPIGGNMMPGGERPGTYGVPMPGAGGPTNYPGIERPMPPMPMGRPTDMMYRGPEQMPPGFGNRPGFLGGGPTNYPGVERPMPPMGNSANAGMMPPGAGPVGGNMMPGGVRPGTYNRPAPMPRDPRGLMRGR